MTNLTTTFSALSDETRMRIFEHLIADGEIAASRFVEGSGISAPAISRHLKVLRNAGLVDQRVEGTHRYYSACPKALRAIADWTRSHRAFWDASLDRFEQSLMLDEESGDD